MLNEILQFRHHSASLLGRQHAHLYRDVDASEHHSAAPQGRHVQFLSTNRPGPRMGMGHYERLLMRSLTQSVSCRQDWRFDIRFSGRAPADKLETPSPAGGLCEATFAGYSPARLACLPWPIARAAATLTHRLPPPDLYHSLSLSYPAPAGRPAVYTIHDLPPARFNDEGALPRWAREAAGAAQAILTPSEFAKRELIEILELPAERIHVVPNGYESDVFHPFVAPADEATLAHHGIHGPFLLYAGGYTRRKNVRSLLEAWAQVASRYPELTLALAGPSGPLEALAQDVRAPRVVVVGYLGREVLPHILKAAMAMVYPSIYEGFGLPPLEAMALGIPVVGVRAGALPEVTGDCAILAPDGSADSLAQAICSLLDGDRLASSLRRRGPSRAARFSWERHAQNVMDVYRSISEL